MARNWLPFERREVPIVGVRIEKMRYSALIDTGAHISLISPLVSIKLGLPNVGKRSIVGLNGKIETAPTVEMPEIGFGAIKLTPFQAVIIEVKRLGLPIDLILGVNAFKKHRLLFDFINERIHILE